MTFLKWPIPLLWIIWLASPAISLFAQPQIGFHHLSDTVSLGAKGVFFTFQIPVSISKLPADNEGLVIEVVDLKTGSANPQMYRLEDSKLVFTKDRKLTQQVKINILGNNDELEEYDIHLAISILDGFAKIDVGTFFLILKTPINVIQKDQSSSYKLSLGANFDLIDGLSINSNYTDISIFHSQLWQKKHNRKYAKKAPILPRERWGMDIWLYQSRSVSNSLNSNDSINLGQANDSFLTASNNVYTRDNLGIYFSPLFRLNKRPQSAQNPMQIYLLGQMEFTRAKTLISDNSLDSNKEFYATDISYIGYGGMGLLFHHSSKSVDFMLKLSSGITFFDYPVNCPLLKNKSVLRNPWYYQTQLRIQEKQFGLKLGADIRGFFKNSSQQPYSNYFYPAFTLFLAKEFSFSQIGKLFGPVGERK